jgi:hypothetical protein
MMKRAITLAALAATMTPAPAHASNWVEVARSKDNINVAWVDADRIVHSEDATGVWLRLSLGSGKYVITLMAMRCPSRTYMELKKTFFERAGTSTDLPVSKEWDFAIPDTVMDGVFDKVCE